jgi:hypothetical protein
LEIGDVTRFHSLKQAISYCGLCGEEKSSADKVMRTPISKQRNKHIQRVLVEAAKLAPRQNHELALVYEKEKQKGNGNRATLAVARKMVAYLLAVDRRQKPSYLQKSKYGSGINRCLREKTRNYTARRAARFRRLPTERRRAISQGSTGLFRDWQ